MSKRVAFQHADWLSLVEHSGAFLTLPVLRRVFAHGLEPTTSDQRAAVRAGLADLSTEAERTAWLRFVLTDLLEYGLQLVEGPAIPASLQHTVPERGVTLRPDFVLMSPGEREPRKPRLLVFRWPLDTDFDQNGGSKSGRPDNWSASPIERAITLCRESNVPLGLVTDTDRFTLVYAPRGAAAGWGTWPSSLFAEERTLLDSFVSLLSLRRFFGVAQDATLEAMFAESADAQAEVTDQLGRQVRAAVELLVGAISRADRATRGELLRDVEDSEVYNAAVTVMMRLVFLLSAEERRLFPIDDDLYVSSYAITSLRQQLTEQAYHEGEDVLEHRQSAWYRVLATFRAVFGGIAHDRLSLPAYGGGLFDPDRYAFLEGRKPGESWREFESKPLPIDDRTMLEVMKALQVLTFREGGVTEARTLSYRSLDVEQIGHVYEGLLDHGCVRASRIALGLKGKKGEEPEIALDDLEEHRAKGEPSFVDWLKETTGRTARQLEKDLTATLEPHQHDQLLAACDNDPRLFERVEPFAGLLRDDLRGLPTVFLGPARYDDGRVPGAIYVTKTSDRRDSGTQYTTKDLADEIVRYALEPIVYSPGPAEGAEPAAWRLKSSAELLKLKVCDPAVGSGAILVAACRYLAERIVEAWQDEMARDMPPAGLPPGFVPAADDLELLARRVVTDHCLFGVDRNPMAAEMAKLSLWLTTMSKERPFTFLDHAIHAGDSLLGITSLEQLNAFHLDPKRAPQVPFIRPFVEKQTAIALTLGKRISAITVLDVRDAEEKRRLNAQLTEAFAQLEAIADLLVGVNLSTAGHGQRVFEEARNRVMLEYVEPAYLKARTHDEFEQRVADIRNEAAYLLDTGRPPKAPERRCLHWPLAFPEVFLDHEREAGFDAMVGNPPFLGGKRISGPMGNDFREYLVEVIADGRKGNTDLVAYFHLRACALSRGIGLLATNTIAQGDTREVGLDYLLGDRGWSIHRAVKSRPWPGLATLEVSQLWLRRTTAMAASLDGQPVGRITASLEAETRTIGLPERLAAGRDSAFIGALVNGIGFVLDPVEAQLLLDKNLRNQDVVLPYLNGEDLNRQPDQTPTRFIINFKDWDLTRASEYGDCLALVMNRVKPQRDRLPDYKKRVRDNWWRYEFEGPDLSSQQRVLALARVSKTVQPCFVAGRLVFNEQTVVFAYEDDFHFGVLTSAFHWWWAVTRASTMRTDIRYTPTDCFETFPQPRYSAAVESAGKALDDHRRPLMIANNEGLTKTYNRVHNPAEQRAGIARLRELHVDLDYAVRDAYDWQKELPDLDHGFHETSQGVRYTVGPAARTEMLDLLLELNHERYAEEVAAGLHDKKKGGKGTRRQKVNPANQPFL